MKNSSHGIVVGGWTCIWRSAMPIDCLQIYVLWLQRLQLWISPGFILIAPSTKKT